MNDDLLNPSEPYLHLSLRGAFRRRSKLLVEEIASPLRGSQ
jgi:hypothetical protein